jgi:sarcosine oxidase, subunit gamma
MSNAVSALQGVSSTGFVTVADVGLSGMISVRADLASASLAAAVRDVTGTDMPAQRRMLHNGDRSVAWMSPDELLILLPYPEAPAVAAALADGLAGDHALVADVSDARAVFRINGAKADDVLRKLSPADTYALAPDEIRRTRIAQVAGAFWRSGPEEITLVTFRSVAQYVMDVLEMSGRAGSELT